MSINETTLALSRQMFNTTAAVSKPMLEVNCTELNEQSTLTRESTHMHALKAKAPAKIILSGEHSVVYGADAIAVAVQKYTYVTFTPASHSKVINTFFSGLSSSVSYPINALSKLKHTLDARFDGYTKGELPVQNILNHPNDLAMYALSTLMQQLPSRKSISELLPNSGILRSESTIPIGSGMGSSASAIAATLVLYEDILQKPMTLNQRFELIRFCERLQHGKGSAIDAATVTFGGVNHIHEQMHSTTDLRLDENWYWLYTGMPQSTTGECVSQVRKNYGTDTPLWGAFNRVTQSIIQALQQEPSGVNHSTDNLKESIKANQQLLYDIGVVSDTAQQVIQCINSRGGAAKVSGAGTIAGERNGLILAYLPQQQFSHDGIHHLISMINLQFRGYVQAWGKVLVDVDGAVRVGDFY